MARSKKRKAAKSKVRARREYLERLRNPRLGVKPPDPKPNPTTAPGSGVDEWRDNQ